MLKNAYLFENEIRRKLYEVWYDSKYEHYFCGAYHSEFELNKGDGADWSRRVFASVDESGNVVGMIDYGINHEVGMAHDFGAINFTDDFFPFARDLATAIDEIFTKFELNKLEVSVVVGNPIESTYDRIVGRVGGTVMRRAWLEG